MRAARARKEHIIDHHDVAYALRYTYMPGEERTEGGWRAGREDIAAAGVVGARVLILLSKVLRRGFNVSN